MIPAISNNPIETNSSSSSQFTVADSGVLIELLSTKLYSDKIGSFIREICTNAIDANIAAAMPVEPITISVEPINGIAVVAIGDCGLGMSPASIRSKLAVLGESTKDGDNLAHGGFGIGFLTVIAVSLNVEIYSFHAGIFYHYRICDNRGELGIYLVESKVADGVGTIVKVWLDRDYDRHTHLNRAGSDLRRAIGDFAYSLKVAPIISSADWQVFSAEQTKRAIARFHDQRLCGDADYAFYLQSDAAVDSSRQLNVQRWSMVSQNLVVMLGEVGYSVSTTSLFEGMNNWWGASYDDNGLRRFKNKEETQLQDFCRNCRRGSGISDSNNTLIVYFEIGELAVSTSRERLVESIANSRRIFDKVRLAYERLKLVVADRLVHSPHRVGVLGIAPSDYFSAAASWNIDRVVFDGIAIDPSSHQDLASCYSNWQAVANGWHDKSVEQIVQLSDEFAKSSFTAAQLLQISIETSRTGRLQVVIIDGESKDTSILRLLKKLPNSADLDFDRLVAIDLRSELMDFNTLTSHVLPWLTKFASVYELETVAGKASLTFNKSSSSTLIWLDSTNLAARVHGSFHYQGHVDDAPELCRLNLKSFGNRQSPGAIVYYFGPTDFTYRLFHLYETALHLLKVDLPDLYIIGSRAAQFLQDQDYQLVYAWDLVLPALKSWIDSSLMVTSERLGFIPTYYSGSDGNFDIIDARLSFLAHRSVTDFVDPAKTWLITWLLENARLANFGSNGLIDVIAASKDWNYTPNPVLYECASKIKAIGRSGGVEDKYLTRSVGYLFADMLTDLPILTRSIGLFSDSHFDPAAERATAELYLQEIENGSLKRWRERNPHRSALT